MSFFISIVLLTLPGFSDCSHSKRSGMSSIVMTYLHVKRISNMFLMCSRHGPTYVLDDEAPLGPGDKENEELDLVKPAAATTTTTTSTAATSTTTAAAADHHHHHYHHHHHFHHHHHHHFFHSFDKYEPLPSTEGKLALNHLMMTMMMMVTTTTLTIGGYGLSATIYYLT